MAVDLPPEDDDDDDEDDTPIFAPSGEEGAE
jgi:hypothetical protein